MLDAGTYKMRPGILELIAGMALAGIEGASGVGARSDHPEDLKKRKNITKGIKAEAEEGEVSLELEVNLDYGKNCQQVGELIQREVKKAIEGMTGWKVGKVDVKVVGVNAL